MSSATISNPIRSCHGSANLLGKGYLLPAPILPRERVADPGAADADGDPSARVADRRDRLRPRRERDRATPFGRLPRDHATALDLDHVAGDRALGDGYGHVELVYDFAEGGEADGWLHAMFRYRHRASGHAAETSFGAHVFNTILTYRDEPQSYGGRPPGLSTRLFLRLGEGGYDTLCHLIYPASRRGGQTARPTSSCATAAGRGRAPELGDPVLRLAALALSRTVRRGDAGPGRERRLRGHPRHDLPAFRLSRAARRLTAPSASTTCSGFSGRRRLKVCCTAKNV